MMKPQDVLVLLEIAVRPTDAPWRFKDLASDLSMSPSEIHAAIKRSTKAGLFDPLTSRWRESASDYPERKRRIATITHRTADRESHRIGRGARN